MTLIEFLSSKFGLQREETDNGVYVNAAHSQILVVVVVCLRQCHEVMLCRDRIAGAATISLSLC